MRLISKQSDSILGAGLKQKTSGCVYAWTLLYYNCGEFLGPLSQCYRRLEHIISEQSKSQLLNTCETFMSKRKRMIGIHQYFFSPPLAAN